MRIIKKKKFWQKSISLLLIVVLLLQTVVPLVYADSREEEWRGAWDQEHPGQEPPEGEYERHVVRDDAKQTGEDISEEEVWERAGGDDDDESSGPSAPAGAPTTSADTSGHYENLQWHIAHGTAEKDASGNWVVTDQSWERAWELTGGTNPDFRAYNEDPEGYREQYPDIAADIDRYYDNNQPGAGSAQDIAVVGAWGTPISEEASNHCQGFTGADRSNCEQIVQHAIDSGEPWYRYCGESGGQCINFDSSHWEAAVQTGLEINQHQVVEAELAASGQEIDPLYRQAAIDYLLYGQRTSEGQYRPATVPEIRTQFASLDTQIKTLRAVVDEALFGGSETEVAKQYGDVAQDVVASLIRQGITGGETLDRAASELKAQMVEAAKKAEIGGPSLEGAAGVSGPMVEPKDKTYYEVKGTGHLTFEYQNKIYAIGINKDGKIDIQGSVLTLTLKEASAADFKFWFENGVPEELLSNFAAADQKYRETLITQKQNEYAQIWAGFQYFQGKSAKPADAPNLGLTSPPEDKKEGLAFRQWLDGQANSASVKEAVSYYQNLAVESGVEGLFRYSKEARAEELYGKSFDEAFEELKNEYGEAVAKATEPAFSLQSAYLAISEGTTVQVGKKPEEVLATRGTGGMMALTTSPTVAEPEVGFGRLVAIAEEIEMEKLRQKMVEPTVVAKPPEKAAPVGESGFAKIFRQKVEEIEVPPAPLKREIASGITLDNPEYYLQAADEKEARDYLKEAEEIAAKIRQEVEAAIIQKDGEITAIVEPRADSIPEIIGSLFVGKEKAVGPTEQRSVHYRLMADGTLYLTYKGELYSFPGESPARKPVYPFFRPAGVPAVIPPAETVEPPAEAQPSGLAGLIGRVGGFFSGLFRREKTPSLEPSLFASPEEMVGPRNVNIDVNYFDQKRAGLPEKIPVGQEFKISGYTFEGKKIEASCVTTPEGCEADLPPGKYDVEGEFVQYRGKAKITVPVPERGGEKLPDYNLALNPKAKGEKEINTLQGSIVIVAEEQVRQPEMPVVEIVAEGKDGRTFQPDYIASLIGGNYEISLPDGEYVLRARVVDPLAKADDPKRILEESPRNFRVIDGILKECDEGWRDCQIPKDTSDIFDVKLEQKGDQVAIVSPPKAAGSGLVGAVHLVAEELSSVAKTGGQSVTQVGNQVSNLTQRVIGGVAGKLFPKKGTPPSGTAAEWRLIEEEERKKAGKTAAIIRERGSSLDLTSTQMQAWATTAFEELATTYDASLEELKINRGGLSLQIGRVNVADTNDPTQKAYWEYREVQEDNEAFYGNLGLTGQYIYEAPYAQAAQPVIQRFKDQQLLLKAIETTNEACGRLKDNCGGQPIHSYDNPETDLTQDQRDLLTVFLMAFSRNEDAKVADAITNIGVMGGQAAGSAYVVAQSGGTLGPLVLANILMSPAGGFTFSLQDQRTLDTFNRLMAAKYGGFVFNSQEAPPNVAVLDEKAYKELFPFSVEEERERLRWELWVRYKEDMSPGMPYRRFIDGQVSNEQYQKQLEVLVEKEVNSRVARQTYENDVVFGDKVIHHLPSAEIEKDYRRTVEKMKSVVNPEENQSFLEVDVEVVDPMVLASYRLLVYDESSSYYGQAPSLKTADGREYLAWGPRRQEDRLATLAFIENLNKLLPEEKRIDPTKTDQIVNMVKLQAALEEYEEFVIGTPLGEQRAETEQTATTSFLTGMAVDALFSNFVDVGTAVVGRFFKVGTLAAKTKYLFGEEVAQEALEKMPVEEGGTLVVRVAKTVVKKGQEEVEEKFIPIVAKGINLGTTVGELLDEARRTTRIPLENVAFRYLNPQASRLVDEGVRDTAWRILPVGGDWLPNIFKPLPEGPEELLAGIPGGVVGRLEEITGKEVASELASRETAIESLKAEMRGARETGEGAAAVLRRGEPAVLPQMDEGIEAAIQATTREAEEAVPPSAWQRFTTRVRELLGREPSKEVAEVFDPELEVQNILKAPSSERPQLLAEYKQKYGGQVKALADLQIEIAERVKNNPGLDVADLDSLVDDYAQKYGFTREQREIIDNALNFYSEAREAAEEVKVKYPDPRRLFQETFGVEPRGKIEIVEDPGTLGLQFKCFDAKDYDLAVSRATEIPGVYAKTQYGIYLEGFDPKHLLGLGEEVEKSPLDGWIALINASHGEEEIATTLIHESEHVLEGLFRRAGGIENPQGALDEAARTLDEFLNANPNLQTFQQHDELERLMRDYVQAYSDLVKEDRFRDEVIAYLRQGEDPEAIVGQLYHHLPYLPLPSEASDELGQVRQYLRLMASRSTDDVEAGFGNFIDEITRETLIRDLASFADDALDPYQELIKLGYSREQAVAILKVQPISKWPKVVERLADLEVSVAEKAVPAPVTIFDRVGNFFRGIGEELGLVGRREVVEEVGEEIAERPVYVWEGAEDLADWSTTRTSKTEEELVIRPLRSSDVLPEDIAVSITSSPRSTYLVAEGPDGTIRGFMEVGKINEETVFFTKYVSPDFRGQGIAQGLTEASSEFSQQAGFKSVDSIVPSVFSITRDESGEIIDLTPLFIQDLGGEIGGMESYLVTAKISGAEITDVTESAGRIHLWTSRRLDGGQVEEIPDTVDALRRFILDQLGERAERAPLVEIGEEVAERPVYVWEGAEELADWSVLRTSKAGEQLNIRPLRRGEVLPEDIARQIEGYFQGTYLVAEGPDGQVRGFIALVEEGLEGKSARVSLQYVSPDFRGQGIARALEEAVGEFGRGSGIEEVAGYVPQVFRLVRDEAGEVTDLIPLFIDDLGDEVGGMESYLALVRSGRAEIKYVKEGVTEVGIEVVRHLEGVPPKEAPMTVEGLEGLILSQLQREIVEEATPAPVTIFDRVGNFFRGIGESLGLVGRQEIGEVAEEAVETGAVISQAKFISNPDSIPQGGKKIRLDPEAVRRYGLAPTVETSVGEVNFYLSKPFKMDPGDGERLAAIVYVETSEGIHSRPVVQSASQGVWRAVSHTDGYGFFGKGLGENSLALPFEVQDALNKLSREEILDLKNSEALGVFYGLLEKSSREYIPSESPFLAQTAIRNVDSLMGGNVRFVDKRGAIFESKVVDGKRLYRLVSVPEGSADIQSFYSPELSRSFFDEWTILFRTHNDTPESKLFIEPSSFQFRSDKAPRKFIGATGELDVCPRGLCKGRGYVFLSEDETIRYLFGRDEATGKLFLMAGEAIYTPINTYGIRTSGLDLGDLAMPLYEYYDQFPTKYIGDALPGSGYFDVSAYIDEFPFIQEVRRVIDNLPSEAPALETKMIRVAEKAVPAPVTILDRVGNFFRGIRESLGITGRRTALPVIDEGVIEPLRKITTVDSQLAGREGQILASLRASLPEDFWQRVNQIHITHGRSRSVFIPSGKDEQGLVYDLYVAATGSFDQSALKRAVAGAVTDYHYTFSGLGETKGLIEVASQRAERSVGGFYADVTAAIVTGNEEELGRLASQGGLSSADIQILRKHTTDVFSGINLDYIQPVSPLERGINFFRNLPSLIQNVLRLSFGSGGSVLAAQTGTEEVNREEVGRAFQSQLGQLDPDQAVVFSPAFYAALKQRLALFEAFAEKNVEKMTEEEVLAVLQEVAEKDLEVRAKIEEKEGRLIMTTGLEGRVSGLVLKGLYRLKAAEIKGIEISMPAEIELTSLDESATLKVGLSSKKKAGWQAIWQKLVKTARAQSLDFESLVAWSSPEAERPVKIPAEKTWLQVELYRDENENGYYDPGEPPVQWAGVKIELESLSRQEEYHLLAGWNLVAFPFQPGSIKTASQLVRDIANQGGHVTIVAYYENGKWQEYVQRGDKYYGLNFRIDPGRAYFLLNHQETKWQVAGLPLEEPLKLTLKAGWNGIGLPDSALTAAELIRKVNEIGCPPQKCEMTPGYENADVVARWYSGLWDVLMQKIILKEGIDTESRSEADRVGSDNYGIDTYGTDFAIESTRGYLLRLKSPVEWAVTK